MKHLYDLSVWLEWAGHRGAPHVPVVYDPAVKKRMPDQGLEIVASTPEAFVAYQAREFARWKTVIETRKITAD